MSEFTFEIEEKLLVLSENDKGWTKSLTELASMERQPNMIFELGVRITVKWARELLFLMKNFRFFLMHLKTDRKVYQFFCLSAK